MATSSRMETAEEKSVVLTYRAPQGAIAWFLQRVTAALLVVFLGAHLWVLHFAVVGESITFEGVLRRMQSPLYFALDVALLGCVIYHALDGLRAVLLDFRFGLGTVRAINWILIVVGVSTFVFGVNALFPFFMGAPLFYR